MDKIRKLLEDRYAGMVGRANAYHNDLSRISFGSFGMDVESGGGLPRGRIVEVYGEFSTGKTALALKVAANAQKMKEQPGVLLVDMEACHDNSWAKKMGINLSELEIAHPDNGEQAVDIIETCCKSGDIGLVILDSVEAAIPQKELDHEANSEKDAQLGIKPKLMNSMARKCANALKKKFGKRHNLCTLLIINQVRSKIGVLYGNPETTPGGKGIPFYASMRIRLSRGEWIWVKQKQELVVAQEIKYQFTKNKTFSPLRTGIFTFYMSDALGHKAGDIDMDEEIYRYAIIYGIIKQDGAWFTIDGSKNRFLGKEKLWKCLRENPKTMSSIRDKTMKVCLAGIPNE